MLLAPDTSDTLLDRALVTAFLENVPDNIYFKDRQSRFIAVSASFVRYFNRGTAADLIGRSDSDFFSEKHAHAAIEDEQRIMRTGQPIVGKLEKETWPDGRVTWVLTSKMPLRNERGEIVGTFGLSKDVTESKHMEQSLEQARRDLIDASRQAGMAEVATGVLHNVGNVLNSLNVSTTIIANGVRGLKSESLLKVGAMLTENAANLAAFLTEDPKGKRMAEFINSLGAHFSSERTLLLRELDSLQKNVEHIKEIVSMQQTYATMVGVVEPLDPSVLMEDGLRMNSGALLRHEVSVVRDYQPTPRVLAEKGKVLQILVNLIRNAKYACDEGREADKVMTLRVVTGEAGRVRLIVQDNGIGIPPENLNRIFNHGFTTRATGHGFGVHSSANAAKEMKGSLTVHSDGLGTGATFTLDLPAAPEETAQP